MIDVLYIVASYTDPDPFLYLRLAQVSKAWYHVFRSDRVWRHLNPHGFESDLANRFLELSVDIGRVGNYFSWELYHQMGETPKTDDPYVWLGYLAFHIPESRPLDADPPFCITNKHLLMCATHLNPYSLHCASPRLQEDKECVGLALSKAGCCLLWASPALRDDEATVLKAITSRCPPSCPVHAGRCLPMGFASVDLRENKEFAKKAVALDGMSLKCFSPTIRDDMNIALLAIHNNPKAIKYSALKYHRGTAMTALDSNVSVFKYLKSFQDDRDMALFVVRHQGAMLQFASERLRSDCELVEIAIANNPFAICFIAAPLRYRSDLVKKAVSLDGLVLAELPKWAGNREVVFFAVEQNPEALAFSSFKLQSDALFILRIVSIDGMALKHVSYELRNSPCIALAAAKQNGRSAVQFLDDVWKSSKHLVMAAIKTYPNAYHWAAREVQLDDEVFSEFQHIISRQL